MDSNKKCVHKHRRCHALCGWGYQLAFDIQKYQFGSKHATILEEVQTPKCISFVQVNARDLDLAISMLRNNFKLPRSLILNWASSKDFIALTSLKLSPTIPPSHQRKQGWQWILEWSAWWTMSSQPLIVCNQKTKRAELSLAFYCRTMTRQNIRDTCISRFIRLWQILDWHCEEWSQAHEAKSKQARIILF